MSLMFFISGIFVYRGIIKKGGQIFLQDRFKILGIPFIIVVVIIIPVAYLPSFYLTNHSFNIPFFISDYIFNQQFPVGPPWFIWLLLLFNVVAVFIPSKFYVSGSNIINELAKNPLKIFIVFFVVVSLAFIPISLSVGQYKWTGLGSFDFQVNRVFLYFSFFLTGTCIGNSDWENHFFTNNRFLNKPWQFWLTLCLFLYLLVELFTYTVWDVVRAGELGVNSAWLIFT